MGPNSGKSFKRVSRGKVSTIANKAIVVLLDLLHQMSWLGIYVWKEGSTHRSKKVCLCWDSLGNSDIPRYVQIWNLWILREASRSEGTSLHQ